jgi:tRNA 2-selenouridine synthase
MSLPLRDDYRSIVLRERPLIDVRAPVEFAKGSFPNAVNLPLMTDEERHLIGIRYKEAGNAAAVALGKELIDGAPRAARMAAWKAFMEKHPDAWLFCFRGGQRSQIVQEWLAEAGCVVPRLKGGQKAFRHYLMEESSRISRSMPTVIIGGRTGSGKTLLLRQLEESIDLEGIAKHRGSSFGRMLSPQPTQIDFENLLAYRLIQQEAAGHKRFVIEHESRNVGRLYIPLEVYEGLIQGEMILLESPMEERIDTIMQEYIIEAIAQYELHFAGEGMQKWYSDVVSGLNRIERRLGTERHRNLRQMLKDAYEKHTQNRELSGYRPWIEALLSWYYDPMYDFHLSKSELTVSFAGDRTAVLSYLRG